MSHSSIIFKSLGGSETVTGSKHLLKFQSGFTLLLDCGLFQGPKKWRQKNWEAFPAPLNDISCIILSHAHIDHSGYIPKLVKDGFRGNIYCTQATYELAQILLPDSAHLQEEDAFLANKKQFSKHHPALPLYTAEDAEEALKLFVPMPFDHNFFIDKEKKISVSFKYAGHILGAAISLISYQDKTLAFTGDLGRPNDFIMNPPSTDIKANFLLLESTYGDRLHSEQDAKKKLEEILLKVISRGGTILIPSFAVGRAQSILYLISEIKKTNPKLQHIPLFLDSPMSIDATKIFCQFTDLHRLNHQQCGQILGSVTYVNSATDSKKIKDIPGSKIIISASGMLTGGRVLHHLKDLGADEKNGLIMVGYQAEGTRGETLLKEKNKHEVKVHGEMIDVKMELFFLSTLSSHADQKEIFQWCQALPQKPELTLLVHGETQSLLALKNKLKDEADFKVTIAPYLEEVHLF